MAILLNALVRNVNISFKPSELINKIDLVLSILILLI